MLATTVFLNITFGFFLFCTLAFLWSFLRALNGPPEGVPLASRMDLFNIVMSLIFFGLSATSTFTVIQTLQGGYNPESQDCTCQE